MAREKLVSEAAVRVVAVEKLRVDPVYQRDVRPGHKKIAKMFNKRALGIPLVGERADGSLWIVDGLQRISALKLLGKEEVRVEVFASSGPKHEAEIFELINGGRTRMASADTFRARLAAGDKTAKQVEQTCLAAGYTLTTRPNGGHRKDNANELSCLKTMYDLVRVHGTEPLKFALEVIRQAWPGNGTATRDLIVWGLAEFWRLNEGKVNKERLVRNCQTVNPVSLIQSASLGVGSRTANMAEAIAKVERKRLRSASI